MNILAPGRMRAVWRCLKYGVLPWWAYERTCHYNGMSYRSHMAMNLRHASKLATLSETQEDRDFERDVNGTILRGRARA